jgi:rhodanese-related sulfurtransferase
MMTSFNDASSGEPDMPQTITRGYKAMLEEASAKVATLSPADAIALLGRDDVQLVDLRDPRELEREGRIPGAFHCPRGMLEFWIDPESPYHKPVFAQDKRFVFFCAAGWRSTLSAATAQDMGLAPVAHIEGGFTAWRDAGGPVEKEKP